MSAGVSSVGFPAAPLAVWLAAFFLVVLVLSFRLVVSSCCFSFRSSGRVSGRCVVGLLVRAGGRGERKLMEEAHPPASTLSGVFPPALVG